MNATIETGTDRDEPYAAIREAAEKMRDLGAAGQRAGRQVAEYLPALVRVHREVQIELCKRVELRNWLNKIKSRGVSA